MPLAAVRLTGYWPYQAGLTASQRTMEGGVEGAAIWRGVRAVDPYTGRRPGLHTLEAYQRGEAPYVSVSGDPDVWPFGQKLELDAWPGVEFRVVDTGGHFTGISKVFRVPGREPLDICVESSQTRIPIRNATANVADGDAWGEGGIDWAALNDPGGTIPFVDAVAEAVDDLGGGDGEAPVGLGELAVLFGVVLLALTFGKG